LYQTQRASEETLTQWFASWDANIAIVTGEVSGLVVIDCDSRKATRQLNRLVPEFTSNPTNKDRQGLAILLQTSRGTGSHTSRSPAKARRSGDGGYAVAPPSIHPNGKQYEWQISLNGDLPAVPEALRQLIIPPKNGSNSSNREELQFVNDLGSGPGRPARRSTFRYACQLRSFNAPRDVAEKLILEVMRDRA
jgi:bifunctional DNA primase/polymerase-like protein